MPLNLVDILHPSPDLGPVFVVMALGGVMLSLIAPTCL